MRAPPEVRFERLQKLIERISFDAQNGTIIVVEGLRDKDALRTMGVSGTIRCIQNSRMNPTTFAEHFNDADDVIVLTDFDRQGVFLAKSLSRTLNSQHVHVNLIFWRDLKGLVKSDARSIEELPKLYQRLQNNIYRAHQHPTHHTRRGRDTGD